jgi:hypothetical protein
MSNAPAVQTWQERLDAIGYKEVPQLFDASHINAAKDGEIAELRAKVHTLGQRTDVPQSAVDELRRLLMTVSDGIANDLPIQEEIRAVLRATDPDEPNPRTWDGDRLDWMASDEFVRVHQYLQHYAADGSVLTPPSMFFEVECEAPGAVPGSLLSVRGDTIREALDNAERACNVAATEAAKATATASAD